MFLNKTKFKRLVKEAWNADTLKVGCIYDGVVVCGGKWIVWVDGGYMPNWAKAILIEFIGEMPEYGTFWTYGKRYDKAPQRNLEINQYLDLPYLFRQAKVAYVVTPIVFWSRWFQIRLIQHRESGEFIALDEDLYSLIDLSQMEADEAAPVGAAAMSKGSGALYWKNDVCALCLITMDGVDDCVKETMKKLEAVDFGGGL